MGTEKRERQKAAKAARLEAERKAEARQKQIRLVRNVILMGIAIIVLLLVLGTLSGCASSDAAVDTGGTATKGTEAPTSTEVRTEPTYGSGDCSPAEGALRTIRFADAPKRCIDPAKTYTAEVETTVGSFALRLDTERTPITANNFVVLARYGYYDGTDLFRTEATTGIIQGGSPNTQDAGDPGPGYTIPDEGGTFTAEDYAAGTLAMARTAAPNSASAQFFLLANDGATYLADPAQAGPGAGTYVAFGTTTEGADVLEEIAALDRGDRTPSKTPQITSVTITET